MCIKLLLCHRPVCNFNWEREKPSGSRACTGNSGFVLFFWSCSSVVVKDDRPLTALAHGRNLILKCKQHKSVIRHVQKYNYTMMQYMATCYSIIYSDFLTLNIILQCHITCYLISDCDVLPKILNGSVDLSGGTTYLSTAIYSCDIGHNIVGNNMRTCIDGGLWNETQPSCQKIGKTFH